MMGDTRRVDPTRRFPFNAVLGQDEARLALLLAAIDPAIGGVLLRGDKGSAKSTLARGLAGLLPGGAPFVELPLGATEDRVLGTLDLKAALTDGETQFRPGLLASAHGGVLYVDEVNLLPDHLVDVLLDVAPSGVNRVERDGVSHEHPARFVLVGSMNPEEGELRPQLLDRFGLSVEIRAPIDPVTRAEVVRRRLTHDAGGAVGGVDGDILLRARLAAALPADLPQSVVDFACHLAVSVGAEGLRADLVLCRAAAAFAGWEGRSIATEADVERVAGLALGHRRRRRPFDPPTLSRDELERALTVAREQFAAQAQPAAPGANGAGQPRPGEADGAGGSGETSGTTDAGQPGAGPDSGARQAATDDQPAHPDSRDAGDATGEADAGQTAGGETTGTGDRSGAADARGVADSREPQGEAGGPAAPGAGPAGADTGATGQPAANPATGAGRGGTGDPVAGPPAPATRWGDLAGGALGAGAAPLALAAPPSAPTGSGPAAAGGDARNSRLTVIGPGARGRSIGDRPAGDGAPAGVAIAATVRAVARRRQADPLGPILEPDDIREPVRSQAVGRTVVVAVDASGSMGTHRRVEAASGAVLGLLADAYLRRDRVAMVSFQGDDATVVLHPTASVELARALLDDLPTGGLTPLAEGLAAALATARQAAAEGWPPLLVTITDGRATGDPGALDRAGAVAGEIAAAGIEAVVLDAEDGPTRLGLAQHLASAMGARYLRLDEVSAERVEAAVRDALGR
jgi:magnesium chelatase subunit D